MFVHIFVYMALTLSTDIGVGYDCVKALHILRTEGRMSIESTESMDGLLYYSLTEGPASNSSKFLSGKKKTAILGCGLTEPGSPA